MHLDDFDIGAFAEMMVVAGHGGDIEWAESLQPPQEPDEFAREAIYVICNSGMHHAVARRIFESVMVKLESGRSAEAAFRHAGKSKAIDSIWQQRAQLLSDYLARQSDEARLAFLGSLPWIGKITQYHLAKNFGVQVAKPDVHLQRLAALFDESPQSICEDFASRSGLSVATWDTLLWRAAATGLLDTRTGVFRLGGVHGPR